ncbi:MAG: MazG nucleotide pyrophosphohydrolase domain-containing protein [Actinomycetota bacterium]
MTPRVVVVGLGPAGADLVLPAARRALERAPRRLVRTQRHPAVAELGADGIGFEALDECYEQALDLTGAYAAIVDRVVAAAVADGEVAYAVPGSPTVAEVTVAALTARSDITVEVVPGLSFADLAWQRLALDPMAGGAVVDAHDIAVGLAGRSGRVLIAQCDTPGMLSEVKLALLEDLPAEHEVIVLQRLGAADESVVGLALGDLDRAVIPDHLTAVFVDTGEVAVAAAFARLLALTERLRGPGGCPWDAAQTHHSLRRHVLEEAYEVAGAIDLLPPDAPGGDFSLDAYDGLEDELGDLLFQVMIHSVLAAEAGAFTAADVAERVHAKLVRRHPHVFGDVEVASADAVVTNWEQIKKAEQGADSIVAGITPALPALLLVQKLLRKAASVGLDPVAGAVPTGDASALGAALAAVVAAGAAGGIDAESALAGWADEFRGRFARMEQAAAAAGLHLPDLGADEVARLWSAAAGSGPEDDRP